MTELPAIIRRVAQSAVVWSWLFNALRLGSGLVLLPLLVHRLSVEELGLHYVLVSLAGLVVLVDFGFSGAIGRAVGYAAGGVQSLESQGVAAAPAGPAPNRELLGRLLHATRYLYRRLTVVALVLLGSGGTWMVGLRIAETPEPARAWLAWLVMLGSCLWEIYASWWSTFLLGLNRVADNARINCLAHAVKLVLAAGLLGLGGGLLSVPLAGLVSGMLQRTLARRVCLAHLGGVPAAGGGERELIARLWPNSWRQGLVALCGFLTTNANTLLCVSFLGLAANAAYGLTLQVFTICQGMAAVWTAVKWPELWQLRARGDFAAMRRILRQRGWWMVLTYGVLAGGAVWFGPRALGWLSEDKTLLPMPWLGWLALVAFLEMRFSFWTTIPTLDNRVPSVWATLASSVLSVALAAGLVMGTDLGVASFVLAPLIAGGLFNYWFWPFYSARLLQSSWPRLCFTAR